MAAVAAGSCSARRMRTRLRYTLTATSEADRATLAAVHRELTAAVPDVPGPDILAAGPTA